MLMRVLKILICLKNGWRRWQEVSHRIIWPHRPLLVRLTRQAEIAWVIVPIPYHFYIYFLWLHVPHLCLATTSCSLYVLAKMTAARLMTTASASAMPAKLHLFNQQFDLCVRLVVCFLLSNFTIDWNSVPLARPLTAHLNTPIIVPYFPFPERRLFWMTVWLIISDGICILSRHLLVTHRLNRPILQFKITLLPWTSQIEWLHAHVVEAEHERVDVLQVVRPDALHSLRALRNLFVYFDHDLIKPLLFHEQELAMLILNIQFFSQRLLVHCKGNSQILQLALLFLEFGIHLAGTVVWVSHKCASFFWICLLKCDVCMNLK